MSEPERLSDEEAQEMLDSQPVIETLAGGTVRVTKAGIVGVGATLDEALRDMADKFTIAFTRPKWPKDQPQ